MSCAAIRDSTSGASGENLERYFEPAENFFSIPAPDEYPNSQRLERFLNGIAGFQTAWFNGVVFGACLLFSGWHGACWLLRSWRRGRDERHASEEALGCTILFCLFNVVYLALVTVALSDGDHTRYRFKVTPLYFVMFGALVWTVRNGVRARIARAPTLDRT